MDKIIVENHVKQKYPIIKMGVIGTGHCIAFSADQAKELFAVTKKNNYLLFGGYQNLPIVRDSGNF